MKSKTYIKLVFIIFVCFAFVACEGFLDRPAEDSYTLSDYYSTDEQCYQAVNPLYNSPWHDFIRNYIRVGDVMSGNTYINSDDSYEYMTFSVKSGSANLAGMSASLWSVNAFANTIVENINTFAGPNTTEFARNTVKGEALVWKALAYFYMVRIWGAVPIIHNNSELIASGDYNNLPRATTENLYDYIIMVLEQAIEWLPEQNQSGRLDRYSAYGLLAKVYLTKSGYGMSGSRNEADLTKAAEYSLKVIEESGRQLVTPYENIFKLENNISEETLISWRWYYSSYWTSGNPLQAELALAGFDGTACWGGWTAPSVDLQDAFGEDALKITPQSKDLRRKATMMRPGDHYDYFWRDQGGFDYSDYCENVIGQYDSPTGANYAKQLAGSNSDHQSILGVGLASMVNGLATHILRLGDVYLIYAEAKLGNAASTSDGKALEVFNAIRTRAGVATKSSITFDDIFKERRLELALEGDFWYDVVRLHYYKPSEAVSFINNQRRGQYHGLSDFYIAGTGEITGEGDSQLPRYDGAGAVTINNNGFVLPFTDVDVAMNPRLNEDPVEYDLSVYTY